MVLERSNKPSALGSTPKPAQATTAFSDDNSRVAAVLPTGESVEVLLYGATVISWKDKNGNEKLWLSDAAKLDGSQPVRGGIPLVFPVFGTAPDHAPTSKLPQHGFARSSRWEFLGSSTSESAEGIEGAGVGRSDTGGATDPSIKLDFGLSSQGLSDEVKTLWPYAFSLVYSLTLSPGSITTMLVVTNDGDKPFDFQTLLHTYLRVQDIGEVAVTGLDGAKYVDKVDSGKDKKQADKVIMTGETDRVYMPSEDRGEPIEVLEDGKTSFRVVRDNLNDVVVWNPWVDKSASMADFEPKDGYKKMICIEAGAIREWQTLEPGDAFEGAQTITAA